MAREEEPVGEAKGTAPAEPRGELVVRVDEPGWWSSIGGEFTFRVVVARVVVYGLAVALLVILLPGVEASGDTPILGALWVGVLYGFLNAFVKPLFGMLTMRFIVQTYGVVMVLINIIIFLLLALLSGIIEVDSMIALILGGIVLGTFVFLLEGMLGLTRPVYTTALIEEEGPRVSRTARSQKAKVRE